MKFSWHQFFNLACKFFYSLASPCPHPHFSSPCTSLPMCHSHSSSPSNISWEFLPPCVCECDSLCPEDSPFPTINSLYPQFTSFFLLIFLIPVQMLSTPGSLPWPKAWFMYFSRGPHSSVLSTLHVPIIAGSPLHVVCQTNFCGGRNRTCWLVDLYSQS